MAKQQTGKHKKQPARTKRGQRGFTLVELLVVLAILAMITGIVAFNVLPERDRAAVRTAKIDIGLIESALEQYRVDMITYPTTEQGLRALIEAPANANRKDQYREGGYLRGDVPVDPWGNPYQYRFPGERSTVDVFSYGADGQPGGEGLNADIGNWPDND